MLFAKKAKSIARKNEYKQLEELAKKNPVYKDISNEIKEASQNGLYHIWYELSSPEKLKGFMDVKSVLDKRGYIYNFTGLGNDLVDTAVLISWEH